MKINTKSARLVAMLLAIIVVLSVITFTPNKTSANAGIVDNSAGFVTGSMKFSFTLSDCASFNTVTVNITLGEVCIAPSAGHHGTISYGPAISATNCSAGSSDGQTISVTITDKNVLNGSAAATINVSVVKDTTYSMYIASTDPAPTPTPTPTPEPTEVPEEDVIVTSETVIIDGIVYEIDDETGSKTRLGTVAEVLGIEETVPPKKGGNSFDDEEEIITEDTDVEEETEPTETKQKAALAYKPAKKESSIDVGSIIEFILIILVILVIIRLGYLKSQGTYNEDLLKEFFPAAITSKFRKKSEQPVSDEPAPEVVNGYLKKSNTAAIRPMYSNAAANATRNRGVAKKPEETSDKTDEE